MIFQSFLVSLYNLEFLIYVFFLTVMPIPEPWACKCKRFYTTVFDSRSNVTSDHKLKFLYAVVERTEGFVIFLSAGDWTQGITHASCSTTELHPRLLGFWDNFTNLPRLVFQCSCLYFLCAEVCAIVSSFLFPFFPSISFSNICWYDYLFSIYFHWSYSQMRFILGHVAC